MWKNVPEKCIFCGIVRKQQYRCRSCFWSVSLRCAKYQLINEHLLEWNFVCVSMEKDIFSVLCYDVLQSFRRVEKEIQSLYIESHFTGFYQFLKVVTPVQRYCSVNVLVLNSSIIFFDELNNHREGLSVEHF